MRSVFSCVVGLCLLGLMGCAEQSSVEAANSQRAKYILVTALDAWKAGHPESLSTRSPAIRFADEDQKAGFQLVDYEFADESAQIKPFKNVKMVLMLKDQQGGASRKIASYQLGVEPGLTVLRSDN